jgi:hypothetical protein
MPPTTKDPGRASLVGTSWAHPTPAAAAPAAAAAWVAAWDGGPVDAFLSCHEEDEGISARVGDKLSKVGYRLGSGEALAASSKVVLFLSPAYFTSSRCCAELCRAVELGLPTLLVVVDGSKWGGKSFPAATDIPETETAPTEGGEPLKPREAFAAVQQGEGGGKPIEHSRSYFDPFIDQLQAGLGPPLHGSADTIGEEESMAIIRSSLKSTHAVDDDDKPVAVVVELGDGAEPADGGLTLVAPKTTLETLRSSLAAEHAADDDDDDDDDPAAKVLADGNYAFVRGGALVSREDEQGVMASELGEPITARVIASE